MATVFITGSNRGLGFMLLKQFASLGYDIIAHSRKKYESFEEDCCTVAKDNGVNIKHIYFGLSDKLQMQEALEILEQSEMTVDVLINNAGINVMKPLMYTEYEDLEESFKVNYFAPVMIVKTISSLMIRQCKGVIINVTSMGSLGHQPGGSIYDASKAALNQFTITAAQELAPFGVRVNGVACGPINTDMFTSMPEKVQSKLIKTTALKRAAEPEEIINTIVYLSTDKSSYVTGQILRVDGGAII